MNRIDKVFKEKTKLLNVYFTAGFPHLNDTATIIKYLASAGADLIEIGIPFSDPLADGVVIQQSSQTAIDNGMTLALLFEQLHGIRQHTDVPLILMGYLNPVLQFGIEKFCKEAARIGIDGIILPDLPLQEYLDEYQNIFEQNGLHNIFLITPQTSEKRIWQIDQHSKGFIYMVASASTTGTKNGISPEQIAYFERIKALNLRNPRLIGFGISDKTSFDTANLYADGAIIGSAFIKLLANCQNLEKDIKNFIHSIK